MAWGAPARAQSSRVQALYDLCKCTFPSPSSAAAPAAPPPASAVRAISSLMDTISPADVGLRDDGPGDGGGGHGFFDSTFVKGAARAARWAQPITYLHVYECDAFSIGIFCLITLKLKLLIIDFIRTLILYYHGVHYHTSSHHLPQLLGAPSSSRILNDAPTRLKNTEDTLHILPSILLCLSKSFPLISYRVGDCLHKNSPLRIDTAGYVVSFVAVVVIDLNIDLQEVASSSLANTGER